MLKLLEFEPIPEIKYRHGYNDIFAAIKDGRLDELSTYRKLILTDLFFIVYFVLRIPDANHPFVVKACQEVQDGPKNYTLHIWAREHYKSTIITITETIQDILGNPEMAIAILSGTRPLAKSFLVSIKQAFETNTLLRMCFPDVIWENPQKDAPCWSKDEGLFLKRKTTRPEASVSAYGLIEGMPTGKHFDKRVYDDITNQDIAKSMEQMEDIKTKFDSSQNLGREGGTHRVIGTYYHHNDPLVYVKKKTDIKDQPMYAISFKPATEDGTRDGKPVLLSQESLDRKKKDRTFNCQQLLDPTPQATRNFNGDMLHPIDPKFIPKDTYNVIEVDQAGENLEAKGDPWAIMSLAVEYGENDIGARKVFVKQLVIDRFRRSAAIELIARMYLSSGMVKKLAVEQVGMSSTEVHIAEVLYRQHGRVLSKKTKNLHINMPRGRTKEGRVVDALEWPLLNAKIFYSTDIPEEYIRKAKAELDGFPHDKYHFLDGLAYLYDILAMDDVKQEFRNKEVKTVPYKEEVNPGDSYSWMAV